MNIYFKTIDLPQQIDSFLNFRKLADAEIPHEFNFEGVKLNDYITRGKESLGSEAFWHIYTDNDDLIGQIELGQKNDYGYIFFFYLLPTYRGEGYFKLMHAKALEVLSKKGFSTIRLATPKTNSHAIAIYEKYGWKYVGEHPSKPDMLVYEYILN